MLQQDEPEDFVIATGRQYSVREFVEAAFREVGVDIRWQGTGLEERGVDVHSGKTLVEVDPRYFRPTEVDTLLGDPSRAREKLGWQAATSMESMVAEMVREDLKIAERDELCKREGFRTFDYNE
jgi:GDPmannose 4,6-dehydratase